MAKKYYVEQVDDEEDKVKKEQAEDNESGLLKKDVSDSSTSKTEKPAKNAEPTEPLEKAKALTEEAGASPTDDLLNQILSKLNDLDTRIAGLETSKTESVEEEPVIPEPLEEDAIGFEGDSPSGPSYSTKADTGQGGILEQDEDLPVKKKVKDETEGAEPTDSLDNVNQLTETANRRTLVGQGFGRFMNESNQIENAMREYAKGVRA